MSNVLSLLKEKGIVCSKQQKQAILANERDTLLLAVPGSGKTTVLVSRIAQMLLYEGYKPHEIIALTYNRAAARDIGVRFDALFGDQIKEKPRFSTVHSLCYTILRQYASLYGKEMPRLLDGSTPELRPQTYLREILSRYSERFLTTEQIDDALQTLGQAANLLFAGELMQQTLHGCPMQTLYDEYTALKKSRGVMDYDDMQLFTLQILTRLPALLARVMQGKRWIFLDEAQDASLLQHKLIELLAKDCHVFFVGDEDQTIYDFRGASPGELLHFTKKHPDGEILRLETNYRCPADLVSAADIVIRYNQNRYPKQMKSFQTGDDSIRVVPLSNYSEQTKAIIDAIKRIPEGKTAAVLAAHNTSLLPIAQRLSASGISYRRKDSDFRFSQNPAVRGFTQILSYAQNPKDKDCFLDAAKTLWFRKTDTDQMAAYLHRFPNGFYAGLACDLSKYEKKHAAETANGFSLMQKQSGRQIYHTVMKNLRYESLLLGKAKDENELSAGVALAMYGLRAMAEQAKDLSDYLRLLEAAQQFEKEDRGSGFSYVTLSTVHGAKGLEFDHVFLLDTIEGCMPSFLPPEASEQRKKENLEQQTRLFYVAATRARERLTVYTAKQYWENAVMPSRFLSRLQTKKAAEVTVISHRAFGVGEVLSHTGDTALVAFQKGVKTIQLDYCIKQGIVTPLSGKTPPTANKERK